MKFAVVVAALCGVAAAGSWERRAEPSPTPEPERPPTSCYRANECTQVCDRACKVVKEDTEPCCMWKYACASDVPWCSEKFCCEYDDDHHTPSPGDDDDDKPEGKPEEKPEPTPTPKPMTICGWAQHEMMLDEPLFNCTAYGQVVNFHEKCCHEETDGECGDQPLCSDIEVCCVVDTELLPEVVNCTTKLDIYAAENNDEELFNCNFEDDYMPYDFEVREDGFLCCNKFDKKMDDEGKMYEKPSQECKDAGAYTKCTSECCCVPEDRFCSAEWSPSCVVEGRPIAEDKTCYSWNSNDGDMCDDIDFCCPL